MAIIIGKRTNLDAPIKVESLNGVAFTTESEAHQFVVRCEQKGQELTLAGTISAKFVRADGNTVQLVGSISDGAAVVTLAQDCYNVPGRFQLAIFNTVGDTKLCIYACVGTVQRAQSGNLIDGGGIIPDVEDLIADIQAAVQSIPPTYDALLASIAGTYSASKTYTVGDYVWYDGSLYRCTTAITTAEAWTSGHWTAAVLGDDLSVIKSAFANRTAGVLNSDSSADLDVTDPDGNVLMRLSNGGIKTKNFDSGDINPVSADTEDDAADLNVIDIYGNVLARFEDGNIQTKKFRSFDYKTYVSSEATYNGSALTLTVQKTFNRGDRVVLHCERGAMPWDYGAEVSYYAGQTPVKTNWRADCAWLEYTVQGDGVQISAVYAANATGMVNGKVRFEVSLLGDLPIRPTVITVKQDGSGDYTTLRGALDAIGTKANDVLNPYRIEIYPGTYNVMDDYTDAEIAAARYDQTGFVGPKLLNGMTIVGIGLPHQVVVSGTLDTTQWQSSVREKISTLNFQGSCSIENLTVKAENLRYCIHDDFHSPMGKLRHVEMKNIVFKATGEMSYSIPVTYGASARKSGTFLYAENCDFGFSFGMHSDSVARNDSCMFLKNCKAVQGSFSDQITDSSYTGKITVHLDGCDFAQFALGAAAGVTPHTTLTGTLVNSPMYSINPSTLYDTSDVVHCKKLSLSVGTAVEKYVYTSDLQTLYWRKATQINKISGIIVYNDDDITYVQHKGYIRTDRLGISGAALGDWIGIDSNGASRIVQSEAEAWGRVVMMNADETRGYVKMKGA